MNWFFFSVCLFFSFALHALHLGIISDDSYFGEREVGWRIKRAAENLGWRVTLDEKAGQLLQKIKTVDFVICLVSHGLRYQRAPNYLTIFHHRRFFDDSSQLLPKHNHWDGFLLTLDPEKYSNTFHPEEYGIRYLPFYPTLQKIPYNPLQINNLVTIAPHWSNRLSGKKYQQLYQMLSQSGRVKFYGPLRDEIQIKEGYLGRLPFDGTSIITAFQKHGISLVLHSIYHLSHGLPSPRIFEAAAASTVIISDENEFVKKNFGDTVYFINIHTSPEEIYAQIIAHLNEIERDPVTALVKAEQAHRIFEDRFTMEQQLIQLKMMNDRLSVLKGI